MEIQPSFTYEKKTFVLFNMFMIALITTIPKKSLEQTLISLNNLVRHLEHGEEVSGRLDRVAWRSVSLHLWSLDMSELF